MWDVFIASQISKKKWGFLYLLKSIKFLKYNAVLTEANFTFFRAIWKYEPKVLTCS